MTYTLDFSHYTNRIPLCSRYVLVLLSPHLSRSYAQGPADSLSPTSAISTLTATVAGFSLTTGPQSFMVTSFITSSAPNSTVSSTTSRRTTDTRPPAFGPSSDPQYDPDEPRERAFNYYFLILAALGVIIAIGLWWFRLRKRRQKEQMRRSGQNALARDLEDWSNSRRWIHGARRPDQPSTPVRREEGLDEHGEAPPPYCQKNNDTVANNNSGEAQDAATGLTIPLRALSRQEIQPIRLPAYQELLVNESRSGTNPDASDTQATRSERADAHTSPPAQERLGTNRS